MEMLRTMDSAKFCPSLDFTRFFKVLSPTHFPFKTASLDQFTKSANRLLNGLFVPNHYFYHKRSPFLIILVYRVKTQLTPKFYPYNVFCPVGVRAFVQTMIVVGGRCLCALGSQSDQKRPHRSDLWGATRTLPWARGSVFRKGVMFVPDKHQQFF